ncbi:MAG: peroxiredoxin [Flavobacterium sp.]|nr:peroxiredoxin [Flavobacterium sp.]
MALKIGDKLPNFTSIDENGNLFDSTLIFGKQPVVVYFYPKDDTPGCTTQACSFRDQYQDFKDQGAEVIGISGDSIAAHQKFVKRYKLPFILLSDTNKKIRKLFDVPTNLFGLIPGRVTYVADKNGIIQLIFDSMAAKVHIVKALEILKKF